jgi:hypothetical protein
MTLAFILLYGLLGASPAVSLRASTPPQSAAQSAPEAAPSGSQQDQKAGTAPAAESKRTSSASKAAAKPSASAMAKQAHKKRVAITDCGASSASSGKPNPEAKPSTSPAEGDSAQSAKSDQAPKNCPPPKIVVRQGGATEPSIQLAGGPATGHASDQKNAAMQLLETTEENLKKISGQQLSSDQREIVTQIQQFMQQSKAAAANGDSERARNLAWKAELLSEDLVNPQK